MRLNIRKLSLKKLQELVHEQGPEIYPEVIRILGSDPRGGAQKVVKFCELKLQDWQRDKDRVRRMYSYERQVWAMGYKTIAGVGEVGRGPLAGPVVAAAVILPGEVVLNGLDDCKRLSAKRRLELYEQIERSALSIGIGVVQPDGIDEANVMMATYRAMAKAVQNLAIAPDYLLVDALHLPGVSQPQAAIVGGDLQSASIAAASIVAKVVRDQHMVEMDRDYPQYGFANHKGYGTQEHREALDRYGPSPVHRRVSAGHQMISLAASSMAADD